MDAALQLDAIGSAHLDVYQGSVPAVLRQMRQSIAGVFRGAHVVALFAEPFAQRISDAQFVVDNQQFSLFGHVLTSLFFRRLSYARPPRTLPCRRSAV